MEWTLTSRSKPICFESGAWDGKKSDQVVCEDKHGERYLAVCYEGTIEVKWMNLPF